MEWSNLIIIEFKSIKLFFLYTIDNPNESTLSRYAFSKETLIIFRYFYIFSFFHHRVLRWWDRTCNFYYAILYETLNQRCLQTLTSKISTSCIFLFEKTFYRFIHRSECLMKTTSFGAPDGEDTFSVVKRWSSSRVRLLYRSLYSLL